MGEEQTQQLTNPLMLAVNTHKDQRHGIIAVSVRLEEDTSLLMALLALLILVATQRGVIDDIVLDQIQDGSGLQTALSFLPGFGFIGYFKDAGLTRFLCKAAVVAFIAKTRSVHVGNIF